MGKADMKNLIGIIRTLLSAKILRLSLLFLLLIYFSSKAQVVNEKPAANFSFVFFTDVHLDYNLATLNYFENAVHKINKINPDFIITGGDNVKDVMRETYSYADSLYKLYLSHIGKFNMPVYSGIGNHECFGIDNIEILTDHLLYGKGIFESKIGKRYSAFSHKGWKFFMIDNILITDTGHKYIGYVDEMQIAWLKRELEMTDPVTPLVICSHIPFISTMKKFELGSLSGNPENDGVSNSIEFFQLFRNHNLKLLLQGHFHFFEVILVNGIYYITGPSLNGRYGSLLTNMPGFLLFKIEGESLTWELVKNTL